MKKADDSQRDIALASDVEQSAHQPDAQKGQGGRASIG